MNDTELDGLLDRWIAPAPAGSLRERILLHSRPKRNWPWSKVLAAAAAVTMLVVVSKAIPQTATPQSRPPYTVLSEFVRYGSDGSATVEMYGTSYNDQYGREILLARHLPDPFKDVMARMLDSVSGATLSARMFLFRLSPGGAEMLARRAAIAPHPMVAMECADQRCLTGVGSYSLPKASINGCADAVVDRETILNYATVAVQLPLDGNRRRRTVWMAPTLGCFALKATTEEQQADGTFRLVSAKQALVVRSQ
jgi:hypothetical protein